MSSQFGIINIRKGAADSYAKQIKKAYTKVNTTKVSISGKHLSALDDSLACYSDITSILDTHKTVLDEDADAIVKVSKAFEDFDLGLHKALIK